MFLFINCKCTIHRLPIKRPSNLRWFKFWKIKRSACNVNSLRITPTCDFIDFYIKKNIADMNKIFLEYFQRSSSGQHRIGSASYLNAILSALCFKSSYGFLLLSRALESLTDFFNVSDKLRQKVRLNFDVKRAFDFFNKRKLFLSNWSVEGKVSCCEDAWITN